MPAPSTRLMSWLLRSCGKAASIVEATRLTAGLPELPTDPMEAARVLVRDGWLTYFHAEQLLKGKWARCFSIGKYQILERLGCGGMGRSLPRRAFPHAGRNGLLWKVLPVHLG